MYFKNILVLLALGLAEQTGVAACIAFISNCPGTHVWGMAQ